MKSPRFNPSSRAGRLYLPLLAAAIGILSVTGTQAATITIDASAESYIRASEGNTRPNTYVLIGDTTNTDDFLRGVFAFDLDDPALTDSPITINSATLTLSSSRNDSSSVDASISIDFHELSASFTETGVTWTSRDGTNDWTSAGGDFGGVLASASANPTSLSGTSVDWSSAALASAAEGSIGSTFNLLGKLNVEDDSQRNVFFFNSSSPQLTLDYTVVPEPSAAALLGCLGILALLRRRR